MSNRGKHGLLMVGMVLIFIGMLIWVGGAAGAMWTNQNAKCTDAQGAVITCPGSVPLTIGLGWLLVLVPLGGLFFGVGILFIIVAGFKRLM